MNIEEFWSDSALQVLDAAILKSKITKQNSYFDLGVQLQQVHPDGPNLKINFASEQNVGNATICSACIFKVPLPHTAGVSIYDYACNYRSFCNNITDTKLIHLIGNKGRIFVRYKEDMNYKEQEKTWKNNPFL